MPVNGGVRSVNVLMNLGVADYDGLQTQVSYRGNPKMYAAVSYTLSKATNTTEPDGNGIGPNDANIARLGEEERGPSVVDQRHRAVITFSYQLPYNLTAGTVTQLASARPFNATTGIDNNGDGANNDRPVVDGTVIGKSAFRGTGTQDVSVFVEGRIKPAGRTILLRLEGFNLFNHGNILGRAQTTYGDTGDGEPDVRPARERRHGDATRSRRWRTSIRRGCSSSRCGSCSERRGSGLGARDSAGSRRLGTPECSRAPPSPEPRAPTRYH